MNRIRLSKFFVFLVVSLFIVSYLPQVEITTSAAQPDDEWVAYPMHITQLSGSSDPTGYSPAQIRVAYGLPSSGGAGTTIAIIDAYYTQTIWNDLGNFSAQFNLPLPTSSNFEVHNMSTTLSIADSNWTMETCLDVEWAHAIAPDAKILLVEATTNHNYDLLPAVDYARNRTDVVAVSMSWGSNEGSWVTQYDSRFISSYGAVFFASSGDNGAEVNWPACSPNVVAVGGTTLNFNLDGTVSSETAWSGSGGGISQYEVKPAYQTSYGVNASKRAVPDVSYDANPSTGVSVYCNSSWYKVGGTSAGAPQWAAIQALGLSATNANLYKDAKLAYSSYFRDITNGSNGYPAIPGYDLVTGLGSPLTVNFGPLTVSPTSGPAGGLITLNGIGFTANSSVNISYLNPVNSTTWVSINNLTTTSTQNFTYTFNAPDLLQNNTAGDNQPLFDNIVFRAQDNSTGNSYNTTIPYTEWRRGLTQIGNNAATGLYGNNTNLATTAFVQNGQSIIVAGKWFSPGNASLLWDGTINLGTVTTDATGLLNATIQIPTTPAGQHTLTINDGVSNFCVNLTRLPTVTNDYDGLWHVTDFLINLTPDYNVNETFYSINNGSVCNVTVNGQPVITTEGSNNTLEYWSTWDIYGTGTMELPHVTLTGIELDKTAPTGSITTSSDYVSTTTITLNLYATDSVSGVAQMRFSNGNDEWSSWEPYATSKTWTLQNGDGQKTVTVQYMDNAGLISSQYSCTVILDTSETSNPSLATSSPSPTPSESPSPEPSATPEVPELSIQMILVLLALSTLSLVVKYKKKSAKKSPDSSPTLTKKIAGYCC